MSAPHADHQEGNMGVRAEELAKKFEESCREFATSVEGLSDADWKKVTHLGSIQATTGAK
jgi:hypothetical protein